MEHGIRSINLINSLKRQYLAWEWHKKLIESQIALVPITLDVTYLALIDQTASNHHLAFLLLFFALLPVVECILLSFRARNGTLGSTYSEAMRLAEFACANRGMSLPPGAPPIGHTKARRGNIGSVPS